MKNKMLWVGSVIILILSVICFVVFGVGTELIRAVTGESNGISFGKYDGKEIVLAPLEPISQMRFRTTQTIISNKGKD